MQATMTLPKAPSSGNKLSNAELCFLVAIASWMMLFGTFILSFLLARVKTPLWPPPYIASFPLLLPLMSTLAIAFSSLFISKTLKTIDVSEKDSRFYFILTLVMGLLFGALQFWALKSWMTFDVRKHVYSSSVAFLIIFHWMHYSVGMSGFLYKFFKPSPTKELQKQSLKLWSWFWHFLGVVWLAIFMAIAI